MPPSPLLRAITLLTLLPGATWAITASDEQPACFKNANSYMTAKFGNGYKDDDHLTVKQHKYGSQLFTEVTDATAGTNNSRTLLQRDGKRGLCLVLVIFPSLSPKVTTTDKAGRPLAITATDQAPGTQPQQEVTYTRGMNGIFKPTRCRHIKVEEGKRTATVVPCPALLSN